MKLCLCLFPLAVAGGWFATDADSSSEPRQWTVTEHYGSGDHGHQNPVLEVEVDLAAVYRDDKGNETLEYDVIVAAKDKRGISYSYSASIRDDRGVVVRTIDSGAKWQLSSGRASAHGVSLTNDLAPGFYRARVCASAESGDESCTSVFFELTRGGTAIAMPRSEWLDYSQATLGVSVPAPSTPANPERKAR